MSLLERLGKRTGQKGQNRFLPSEKEVSSEDQYQELKLAIHRRIVDDMNLEQQRILTSGRQERREVENIISSLLTRGAGREPVCCTAATGRQRL